MHKRTTYSMVFSLLLMVLISATAFAADIRASNRFMDYTAAVHVENSGNLNIYFSVTASGTMDVLGASKIAVQRLNGSRWVTESTLTVADAPEMQTSNAFFYSASIPYEPDHSNANYRAIVTVYAKDGSGSSTAQVTT